jgi:hypothetical protein
MKGRIEPEPAFGGKVRLHHHVGDQEAIHEDLAFDFQAEHAADRAARAVGGDQPVGFDGVHPVGVSTVSVAPVADCVTETTLFFQRSSMPGRVAARATRYSSR